MANLAGGLALLRGSTRGGRRWGSNLAVFEAGVLAMATWMAGSERVLGTNTG